ncbi:MAG: hypothetical protein P1S60_14050, partial [Anaerolineae bacterium]|nr:hypothetical protein [Anaerolineae bacterium]
EPPGLQMQDLLQQPFKYRRISKPSKYESRMWASAYWQLRILNFERCMEHTHLRSGDTVFNVHFSDPITNYLDNGLDWQGVTGDYIVTVGAHSHAEHGMDANLPTLTASVGAFTRMWMGILPATSLSLTDELAGPPQLLDDLDWLFRLPKPRIGWDY